MEGAHLRPVPRRPQGPVDPERASGHVAGELPGLDGTAARALGLVEIAGLRREQVGVELELSPDDLGAALARGRKTLRRALFPLPGSGWCERAERMISDRLDGELEPPGSTRLEVHLRNCERCVEHDLRLAQATDGLLARFVQSPPEHPEPEPHPVPEPKPEPQPGPPRPEPPMLRIVQPQARPRPARLPEPAQPAPKPAPPPALPLPAPSERRIGAATVSGALWTGLLVLAVVLAVATAVIALLGVLGTNI